MNRKITENFVSQEEPQDVIYQALEADLDMDNIPGSLKHIGRLYEKARFDTSAKFGLLRSTACLSDEVVHFLAFGGPTDYTEIFQALRFFWFNLVTFIGSSVAGLSQDPTLRIPSAVRPSNVEQKVDVLADEMANLSLFIKRQKETGSKNSPPARGGKQGERLCSYCREPGHGASRCPKNLPRNTIFLSCDKLGHSEAIFWTKIKQ